MRRSYIRFVQAVEDRCQAGLGIYGLAIYVPVGAYMALGRPMPSR